MNPSEIMKALEIVLTDRDFQIIVSESDSLLCERSGVHYRIKVGHEERPFLGESEEEIKILIAPEETAEELAPQLPDNTLIWPLEDLEREVGRIALAAQGIESASSSTFLDRLLSGGPVIRKEPAVSAFVAPIIDERMAREISEETVKGFSFEMEFIPHYIYTYSVVLKNDDGEERERAGEMWMNAVSGVFVPPLEESELLPSDQMSPGQVVEPEIDSDEALDTAREEILNMREEEKEAVTEVPGAVAINRKVFLPQEDSLVLSFRGTVYLPVWSIEGIHGSIIIDAVKGELVSEVFFEEPEAEGDAAATTEKTAD